MEILMCNMGEDMELKKLKTKAFTLAEVLITIGIVGVIAAMTIPSLSTSVRNVERATRLKKFYSTMRQAFLLSVDDNGDPSSWNIYLSYENFYKIYFVPYLKYNQIDNDLMSFQDGSNMKLIRYNGNCMDIVYDTNGKKMPNKEGQDQFRFLICPSNVTEWCGDVGFCTYRRNSYKGNRNKLLECCKSNCSGNAGLSCSALIEYDGWKFSSDYPHK